MTLIQRSTPPQQALIDKYTSMPGAYTDCYSTDLPFQISFPDYLFAFYTTPLFKLERLTLLLIRRPSTDRDVRELADGKRDKFAAWTVEARIENQILMCAFLGRTRSWLMTMPAENGTRLFFGSVVVPKKHPRSKKYPLGFSVHALMEFHKIYSVSLLYSARVKVQKSSKKQH